MAQSVEVACRGNGRRIRVEHSKTKTPSTEASQHCAVSRDEEHRGARSWMRGEATARPAKRAATMVWNCILFVVVNCGLWLILVLGYRRT